MKRTLLLLVILLLNLIIPDVRTTAQTTRPAIGSVPKPDVPLPPGITPLFDGKSLDGWVQVPDNSWAVKDGIIASLGVGRGVLYTTMQYGNYRVIFDVRHVWGSKPDHQPCVLFFGTMPVAGEKPLDALGAVQLQVPKGYTWDYRKGHNNAGKGEFKSLKHPKVDAAQWSRVELLINSEKGTARMAVAQPVGSDAVEVVDFDVPDAGKTGPFALQMHNKGLLDEYANMAIEVNPTRDELITVNSHP